MKKYTLEQLAQMIDHTNLKATATNADIVTLCEEAKTYGFASACFNPVKSEVAGSALKNTNIKACSVIGFPLGQNTIETKAYETMDALANGANEIDYVINVSEALVGNWDYIAREMITIVELCKESNALCKVIFENGYLTKDQIKKLCEIATLVKPSFVKTSTGTISSGATPEDIALMAANTPEGMGIKASGGIRTAATFIEMIKNGATRVGASASKEIMKELKEQYFSNGEEFLEI